MVYIRGMELTLFDKLGQPLRIKRQFEPTIAWSSKIGIGAAEKHMPPPI